jgi:hypothetical protein
MVDVRVGLPDAGAGLVWHAATASWRVPTQRGAPSRPQTVERVPLVDKPLGGQAMVRPSSTGSVTPVT